MAEKDNEKAEVKPLPKQQQAAPPKKVPWVKLSPEEHQKQYPYAHEFLVINKLGRMSNITITKGNEDFQRTSDANGFPVSRENVADALKTCPPMTMYIGSRNRETIKVPHREIVYGSHHLEALLREGHIVLREKIGDDFADLNYEQFMQEKAKLTGGDK